MAIFVAFVANTVVFVKAIAANPFVLADLEHIIDGIIIFALTAIPKMLVATRLTHLNIIAATVDDRIRFAAKLVAKITNGIFTSAAIVTIHPPVNHNTAGNTQPVSADRETFEIFGVVVTDRKFGVEFFVIPIAITAEPSPRMNQA